MKAYIIRHGESFYRQRETTIDQADDLTTEGIERIIQSGKEIMEAIQTGEGKEGVIMSSRFGRNLHSARLFNDILSDSIINIRKDIAVCDDLEEIGNFDWNIFLKLVKGGEIEYKGITFPIDPSLTNPCNYGPVRYFRTNSYHKLSNHARKNLPVPFLKSIDSIEGYESVQRRFQRVLNSLNSEYAFHFLITHEGTTGNYVEKAVGNAHKTPFLDKGKYFVLEKFGDDWMPTKVQNGAIKYESE